MSKEDLVEVTAKMPKAFVDHIKKQPWFRYYGDLDAFAADALRRLKEDWMKKRPIK